MKVLKFGGTSVGTIESLKNVKSIVESQTEQVIIVVSALGGVTDQLIAMTKKAENKDKSYKHDIEQLYDRHINVLKGVVPDKQQNKCKKIIHQFINLSLPGFLSMLSADAELSPSNKEEIENAIVSLGEILSSAIVSFMLNAIAHYSPNFIKTKDVDGQRILDNSTFDLIKQEFNGCNEAVAVVQGFISADIDDNNIKTNLGRGGSDFTAALIASALDAKSLEIWTDVDGFYTADPKKDPTATIIDEMTFAEAQILCEEGAKVIYAPTLSPVALKNIPTWVKNTFNVGAKGTLIVN